MRGVRLGWRFPRPNDFRSADLRPLRDTFGNLQHHMTWPHAGVAFSGNVPAAFGAITLTAINAPLGFNGFQLVRNNTIQVPREFDSYMAVGACGAEIDNSGAGTYYLGWVKNGVQTPFIGYDQTASATVNVRIVAPICLPVRKGETLAIHGQAPVATPFIGTANQAYVYFLPLV